MRTVESSARVVRTLDDADDKARRKKSAISEAQDALKRLENLATDNERETGRVIDEAVSKASSEFAGALKRAVSDIESAVERAELGSHRIADAVADLKKDPVARIHRDSVEEISDALNSAVKAAIKAIEAAAAKSHREVADAMDKLSSKVEESTGKPVTFDVKRDGHGKISSVVARK